MNELENEEFGVKAFVVRCQICPWEVNATVPHMGQVLMIGFDLHTQRKVDDTMAEHLRSEHGLMSVLQHTSEMNAQADRSFKDGEREGLSQQNKAVKMAMREVMRELMTPMVDDDDD